jgi:hypothetical protein
MMILYLFIYVIHSLYYISLIGSQVYETNDCILSKKMKKFFLLLGRFERVLCFIT